MRTFPRFSSAANQVILHRQQVRATQIARENVRESNESLVFAVNVAWHVRCDRLFDERIRRSRNRGNHDYALGNGKSDPQRRGKPVRITGRSVLDARSSWRGVGEEAVGNRRDGSTLRICAVPERESSAGDAV